MKASFKQRFLAYLIDIVLLAIILVAVDIVYPKSEKTINLNTEYNELTDKYLNNEIEFDTYFNKITVIYHNIDKENVIYGIINAFFILIYFVLIPFLSDGKTIGKKILKIKVVRKDGNLLEPNDLIFRNIILNGLGYMVICLALVYVLPDYPYYLTCSILGLLQFVLFIITVILTAKTGDGLHDKIGHTSVVCD